MSARDSEIALDIVRMTVLIAPAAVEAVRRALEAARPDLQIAEPPPDGQHAQIVAEDPAVLARRFGGGS